MHQLSNVPSLIPPSSLESEPERWASRRDAVGTRAARLRARSVSIDAPTRAPGLTWNTVGAEQTRVLTLTPGGPRPEELRAHLHERFGLTERESEVALLLARRASNKEIARLLEVSTHTAERHTERILYKLGVASRRDIAEQVEALGRRFVYYLSGAAPTTTAA